MKNLTGRGVPKAQQARFKLLAPVLGCRSPDELIQRDRARFRRQAKMIACVFLVLMLGSAAVIWELIRRERVSSSVETIMTADTRDG